LAFTHGTPSSGIDNHSRHPAVDVSLAATAGSFANPAVAVPDAGVPTP
jgi:hypothetical protein